MNHAVSYLTVRRLKRAIITTFVCVVILLMWRWTSWRPSATSAVGCKSKLAQILWPDVSIRREKLEHLGYDVQQLEEEYHIMMNTLARQCYHQIRVGKEGDGGWDVCVYDKYRIQEPCLVYSFGIGDDWAFEKQMEMEFGCEVHAFDPSIGMETMQYSDRGYFHNVGIDNENSWAVDHSWKMRTLKTIMEELGHQGRTIDYLKMDVEFSEWPALYDIIESGLIRNIRQLAIETHTPEMDIHTDEDNICTWATRDTLASMTYIMIALQNSGMQSYYSTVNYRTQFKSALTQKQRYCCHNLHFVNVKHPQHQKT